MPKLGVNIDHVATLRQARRGYEPDPILAARLCEEAGCDSIVAHLREDRRHINDNDVRLLRKAVKTRFNMEISINPEIIQIACSIKPDQATIVPERRQEITTEGGLDVVQYASRIDKAVNQLKKRGIVVSLFIDPDPEQIEMVRNLNVTMIELHTGRYAHAKTHKRIHQELRTLKDMTKLGVSLGIVVNAGHGLNYENTKNVAQIEGIEELNIGHSIISRAVSFGLKQAVREMLRLTQ